MVWLSVILLLIITGLISLLLPLKVRLNVRVDQEIIFELRCELFSIPIYSKTDHISYSDFFDDYIQPFIMDKKHKNHKKTKQLRRIKLTQLKWHSTIGLDDASETALSVSGLMMIKGVVIQIIGRYLNHPDDFAYHVTPDFDQFGFKSDCQCMFSIRLGQAIRMKLKR